MLSFPPGEPSEPRKKSDYNMKKTLEFHQKGANLDFYSVISKTIVKTIQFKKIVISKNIVCTIVLIVLQKRKIIFFENS